MPIGETLKALRTQRGWGQAELAQRAGITQPVISVLESGRQDTARSDTLVKLAEALEVEVGDFFAEGGVPPIPPPTTRRTDEKRERFDKRLAATNQSSAEKLREEVDAEFDRLQRYIKQLKALEIDGFPLRRALDKLGEASARLYAVTRRATDLDLNAGFGEKRPIYDSVGEYVGESQEVAAKIEAENTEAHAGAI